MHTEHVKAANPAYERLLQDYVDYHLALVVVGGFFTLALLALRRRLVGAVPAGAAWASSDAPTSGSPSSVPPWGCCWPSLWRPT